MPFNKVKEDMGELSDRLSEIPADTSKLEQAIDDAQKNIDTFTPDAMKDFVQFLKVETEALETEHPDLTDFINQIMVTLSNIGI